MLFLHLILFLSSWPDLLLWSQEEEDFQGPQLQHVSGSAGQHPGAEHHPDPREAAEQQVGPGRGPPDLLILQQILVLGGFQGSLGAVASLVLPLGHSRKGCVSFLQTPLTLVKELPEETPDLL